MTGFDEADLIRRADAARTAFLRTGTVADAEEVVRLWSELVALNSDNADYFDELGSAFQCLYEAGGVGEHLRRARVHYEKAVELDRDPALLNNLGDCLRVCHRDLGDRDALEQARVVLGEAIERIPEVDPDRLLCMDNLALVLSDLFSLRGDPDELRQAFSLHEEVVVRVAPEDENAPLFWNNLGGCAQQMFGETKEPRYLWRSVEAFRAAVEHSVPGSPAYALRLANLASGYQDLLECGEEGIEPDEVIACAEEAVNLSSATDVDRSRRLRVLGDALRLRNQRSGESEDVERALAIYQEGLQTATAGSYNWVATGNNLALTHLNLYDRLGSTDSIDAAVERAAVTAEDAKSFPPLWALCADTLASALIARYENAGVLADLDRAIEAADQSIRASSFDGWTKLNRLRKLAAAYAHRFDATGDQADQRRALDLFERAAADVEDLDEPHGPDGLAALHDLGVVLRDRFGHSGDQQDIDRAVDCLRRTTAELAEGSPMLPRGLGSLARVLSVRYRHTGELTDMTEGLEIISRLAGLTEDTNPIWRECRGDHAGLLRDRFERTGDSADLDMAIALYARAVDEIPPGAPATVGLLNDWASCLRARYLHTGAHADLTTAERGFRAALDTAEPTAPARALYLDNLGVCLADRYDTERDPVLLDSATELFREAIASLPDSAPDRLRIEVNLASALWERWWLSDDTNGLDSIIDVLYRALAGAPPNSTSRARLLSNLAVALEAHRRFGGDTDLEELVELHRNACVVGMASDLGWCLQAARRWGRAAAARGRWGEAEEAHDWALDASRRLFVLQNVRRHKEDWLRHTVGFAGEVVVTYLRLGRRNDAVRVLEESRAQLLSETLARNAIDLDALAAAGRPELARRCRTAVERLAWMDGQDQQARHAR